MLYAYRWQVELLFRFLKRTMNGLHLIKQDQDGVNIQFYAMLIVALLQLRLKQEIADNIAFDEESPEKMVHEEENEPYRNTQEEANTISLEPENRNQEKLISSGMDFIKTIGENLEKYWKIGIHWLTTLRGLLAQPFDARAIEILNTS